MSRTHWPPGAIATTAGISGTATMDQGFDAPRVQDMVVDAAPGLVLAPPRALPASPLPLAMFHCVVWDAFAITELASPFAVTVSITTWPVVLVTLTEALVLCAVAVAGVPNGVDWSTPVNEMELAAIAFEADMETTTLAVPGVGASRYHISVRFWFPPEF